jgi:hypothetical protein
MARRFVIRVSLALLLLVRAPHADAQTEASPPPSPPPPVPRGSGAFFRGAATASDNRLRSLDLSVTASSAYDDDLSQGQNILQPLQIGGQFSDISTGLTFARKAPHLRMQARAGNSLRHYPTLNRVIASNHSAGMDLQVDAGRRTVVHASVDESYVSEFAFDTFSRSSRPDDSVLAPPGSTRTASDGSRRSYGGAFGLTRTLTAHSSLTLAGGTRLSDRPMIQEHATENWITTQLARRISNDTTFHVDYNLRSSSQQLAGTASPAGSNDVQVGLDHRWRHARERRTTLSLAAGPALLQSEAASARRDLSSGPLRLVGVASLSHDMSRSWNLGGTYHRTAGTIDGVVSDTATLDLRGLLSTRVELGVSGGYSYTDLGLSSLEKRLGTRYGSARLEVALTRAVAMYGEYVLYEYDFAGGVPGVGGVPVQLNRRGVRAGLTWWTSLREGR